MPNTKILFNHKIDNCKHKVLSIIHYLFIFLMIISLDAQAWNPGTPNWGSSGVPRPEYAKHSGHPFLLTRSLAYLYKKKGVKYYNKYLVPYGGNIVYGSSFADVYKPHGYGDSVNHYYTSDNDHDFGCPPASKLLADIVGYECSYTDAASYADYLYDRAVDHWLGIRLVGLGVPKYDKVGVAIDRDLITSFYAYDNTKEKAAIYLGWAAHMIQDQTNPYHTTNNLIDTLTYHKPFEDSLDQVIQNKKLHVPLESWTPNGGFFDNVASKTNTPNPSSVFISKFPTKKRRPSEIAIDNALNSKPYINYLKETACLDKTAVRIRKLLHAGKPCDGFYENSWGQVMQVQADRAVKSAAELISMFLEEVHEPRITFPINTSRAIIDSYGGSKKSSIHIEVDSNSHTSKLILDAKWKGSWHKNITSSTNNKLDINLAKQAIPDGKITIRVRACYGSKNKICTDKSDTIVLMIDTKSPQTTLTAPISGKTFSDKLRVGGYSEDSNNVFSMEVQALFSIDTKISKSKRTKQLLVETTTNKTAKYARSVSAKKEIKFKSSSDSKNSRTLIDSFKIPTQNYSTGTVKEKVIHWKTIATSNHKQISANLDISKWPEQTIKLRIKSCDEATNCSYSSLSKIKIDHSSIDLYVKEITIDEPVIIDSKKSWPVTTIIKNSGSSKTGSFQVDFDDGSVSSINESDGLSGNSEKKYKFYTIIDPNQCETSFTVTVDPNNKIPELNKSNNKKVRAYLC